MPYTPRTIAQIQSQIIFNKNADANLSVLNSTSQVSYWNLWTFITAMAISLLEQIMSIFIADVETVVSKAVPGTALWIQSEVFKFQAGDVVSINSDFTIDYPIINVSNQIIKACAVVVSPSGAISVKVAKGSPLAPLSGGEVTELNSYLDTILPAGQTTGIISVAADLLQVNAIVYYNGQFNSVIQTNVNAALTDYLSIIPFNGLVKISDIEKVILGVQGVVDVTFSQITVTPFSGSPANLILASALVSRSAQTYSGYLVNDPGNLFSATITYSVAQQ